MTGRHLEPSERHARLVARARRGDDRARDALVRELLPMAERVARRFASPNHPEEDLEQVEAGVALQPLLSRLSPRERMVLDLRFDDGLSQSEIAAGLGVSQTQISRILRRAIAKLSEQALASA